ncbi:MAG: hypothetical protein IJ706_06125, partial [Clostridia bacterium]|nr:hypothetical protein [Clostridia bacterium]
MKKLLVLLMLIVAMTMTFAACLSNDDESKQEPSSQTQSDDESLSQSDDESIDTHEHSFTVLRYDENGHWYECESGDGAKLEVVPHTLSYGKDAETHYLACSECEYVSDAVPHDFGETGVVTTAPTCTENGEQTFTCVCGATKTESIDKLDHKYEKVEAADPSCTEDGHIEFYECGNRCGKIFVLENGEYVEIDEDDIIVDALGHDLGKWLVSVPATCTAKGEEKSECSRCDYYETRETDMIAHTPVTIPAVPATCTATGLTEGSKCSVCETILVEQQVTDMIPHTPDTQSLKFDENSHWYTCAECGTAIESTAHSASDYAKTADTHAKYCDVCNYEMEAPAAHSKAWAEKDGVEYYACTVCGYGEEDDFIVVKIAERQDLYLNVDDSANPTGNISLDIGGIGNYSELVKVSFAGTQISESLTFAAEKFGKNYGEKDIIATVKTADGATHEVVVPVTLITKIIYNFDDMNKIRAISTAIGGGFSGEAGQMTYVWGGHFILGADLDYDGASMLYTDMINYKDEFWTPMKNDARLNNNGNAWQTANNGAYGFQGTFDGRGHVINGYLSRYEQGGFLASCIGGEGVIKNVNFTNAILDAPAETNNRGYCLLPYVNFGTLENIYIDIAELNVYGTRFGALSADGNGSYLKAVKNVVIDYSATKITNVTLVAEGEEQKAYIYADFFGSKVKNTSVENLYIIKGNGVAALEDDFRTACASTVVFDGKEAFLANENVGAMLKSMNIDRKLNYAVAEVDLDTESDGSLNTVKTVEIDLAEVLGNDDGELVSVKIADKTIEGAALNGTTLTAAAASFGYAYYYMDMTVRTENNVYVVPVSFITKTINTKADLDAMPTISKAVYADNANLWGGYFVFGSDIEYNAPDKNYSDDKNYANVWTNNKNNVISGFACSDDYKVGGFKGVIDGRGHDISRFIVSFNGLDNKDRAFVSHLLGGTIQNLSFTKASIGPHAQLLVSRSSNHNGKIRNIYVSMEYLNVYRTGYVTPANNDLILPDNAVLFGFNENESSQSRGTSKYLTVKNCIVDFGDLYDAETMLFGKEGTGFKAKNTYLLGKFFSANKTNYPFDTLNGVYVIGLPDAYVNVAANANGSGAATGVWGRYATAADMLADEAAQARIAQFDAQYWTIVNGVPVFKGLTDKVHYHAYKYVAETPASCKETGVIGHFTCDGCDKKFVATAHGFYYEVTDEELVIPMTAHTFGDWQTVKAATCTEKGEEKRICSVCGEVETREIELAAHEMTKHDEVKASCTATGMKEYYSCSLCNYNYLKDDEGNFVKATDEELVIQMTAHTPDETSLQKDETGHWFNCTVCGQAIDKAAHTSSEWLIGENGHYKRCTVCEYITVPEEEHTYEWVADESTNTEFKACSLCKFSSGETMDLTITQRQDIDLKSTTTNYILSQSPILNGQFGELVHKADDILLDLSEIGTNLTITKVVFENYVTGYALNEEKKLAISTEAARELSVVNGKIPAQEFGKNYGEATLKVTFTTADGAEHETSVPVTLVNMFLTNKDDFIQMKRVAHTITGGDAIISYGGYFALAADVDFEGSTLGYGSLISNNNTAWARFKDVFGSAPVWVDHPDLGFRGTFDGRGHVISNYTVTFTQTGFLTNIMATEGTIKNVNFLNAKLIKEATGTTYNGNSFFPWINNGQLENIYLQLNEVDAPKNDSTWAVVNGVQYKNRALINNLIIDFSEATSVNVSGGTASKYTFYAVSHYYYPVLADGRVGNENVFIIYNPETITPVFNKDTDDTQISVHFNTVYLTPKPGTPYIVDNFDSYEKFADNDKVKAMLASWNPFENIHVYGAWETVKPATCTEKGEESRKCLFCDKTETREIALKAHSLTIVEAVNATCTETGTYEYYICSECYRKFVEIDGDYTLVTDEELVMPMTEHTPDQTSLQK